jgi:hypothetical protein
MAMLFGVVTDLAVFTMTVLFGVVTDLTVRFSCLVIHHLGFKNKLKKLNIKGIIAYMHHGCGGERERERERERELVVA